jgi:hypothetical protein
MNEQYDKSDYYSEKCHLTLMQGMFIISPMPGEYTLPDIGHKKDNVINSIQCQEIFPFSPNFLLHT